MPTRPTIFSVVPSFRRDAGGTLLSRAGYIGILSDKGPMLVVTQDMTSEAARAVSAVLGGLDADDADATLARRIWDGKSQTGCFAVAAHLWAGDGGQVSLVLSLTDEEGTGDFVPFVPSNLGKEGAGALWEAFTALYRAGGIDEQLTSGSVTYDQLRARYSRGP